MVIAASVELEEGSFAAGEVPGGFITPLGASRVVGDPTAEGPEREQGKGQKEEPLEAVDRPSSATSKDATPHSRIHHCFFPGRIELLFLVHACLHSVISFADRRAAGAAFLIRILNAEPATTSPPPLI